jgi:hypothetical protein
MLNLLAAIAAFLAGVAAAVRKAWKAAVGFSALLVVGTLIWAVWFTGPSGTPDRWFVVVTGTGAIAATIGVAVGGGAALLYGRRASASLSAKVEPIVDSNKVILVARPVVKSVGLFRVKLHGNNSIEVRECRLDPDSEFGLSTVSTPFWTASEIFGEQQIDGGEELTTSQVFLLRAPPPDVVGWLVGLNVQATRWLPSASDEWEDQVFVPKPGGGC